MNEMTFTGPIINLRTGEPVMARFTDQSGRVRRGYVTASGRPMMVPDEADMSDAMRQELANLTRKALTGRLEKGDESRLLQLLERDENDRQRAKVSRMIAATTKHKVAKLTAQDRERIKALGLDPDDVLCGMTARDRAEYEALKVGRVQS